MLVIVISHSPFTTHSAVSQSSPSAYYLAVNALLYTLIYHTRLSKAAFQRLRPTSFNKEVYIAQQHGWNTYAEQCHRAHPSTLHLS